MTETTSLWTGPSPQTFIFDLDGTLLDTLRDLAASVNYALQTCGMPQHSIDDVRRFVGNGVRLLMERAVPDGAANPQFEQAFATFRQHYMQHSLDTTRPYEGVLEMLQALRARGCRTAVVSNKFYAATQELCRHFFAMWATVMSTWRQRLPVACPASVCCGASATANSCWHMVPPASSVIPVNY